MLKQISGNRERWRFDVVDATNLNDNDIQHMLDTKNVGRKKIRAGLGLESIYRFYLRGSVTVKLA